nr:SusC/RagA family TonB-linked outer membrane protein [Proteiniphilum sp. UBA5280]
MRNRPLRETLKEIEKVSEYKFFYNESLKGLEKKSTTRVTNSGIDVVMQQLLAGTNITYRKNENNIIVLIEKDNVSQKSITEDQNKKTAIKGHIVDAAGEPIIGATIIEKENPSNGTVTNMDGDFTLEVSSGSILIVSYIGYRNEEVPVSGRSSFNITMQEDTKTLEELVVVGYGVQKKINLTGSVTSINTDDIKDRVQPNVLSAIQGAAAGVTVISRPGQTPSINFRGRGNLGTSAPLYVIDGAISDASFFANLDPNSIESISFLKDAASSAIYGSRAAYGVVLVTTRQGKQGNVNVSYSGYYGFKTPTYEPKYVNSWEYAELFNEAKFNSNPAGGKNQGFSDDEIKWFKDGSKPDLYPNTNWADLIFKDYAPTTQHSLSFNGGSEKIRYYTGLGYLYDTESFKNRNNQRYNLNLNVSSDLTSWLTFNGKVKYIQRTRRVDGGTPSMANMLIVPSTFVAKQSNGDWGSINAGQLASGTFIGGNPLRSYGDRSWSENKTTNSMFEIGVDLKPLKDLIISAQGVYQNTEYKGKSYSGTRDLVPNYLSPGTMVNGSGNTQNIMNMDWNSNMWLNYTTTANYSHKKDIHDLTFLLGSSYEQYKYEALNGSRENFPADTFTDMSAGATSGPNYKNSSGSTENKMLSYFSRITYSLSDRYLVEANFRADASSRFHKDNRWGYFPSFSAGWRISEETFMKETRSWLDNLKLRVSYGSLGNINNVGNYDYFQNYASNSNYTFDNTPVKGIRESKPANEKLGWEKVTMSDIGLDADFWNGKLRATADYYIKKTSDILLGYNVPWETGISNPPSQNIAKVRNKGFEFTLNHQNTIGKISYVIGGNVSINNNRIIDLATSKDIISNMPHGVGKYILREGESIGSFYGFKTDGLYTQSDIDNSEYYKYGNVVPNAGDIKFIPQRDIKYKESITNDDRAIIGNDVPNITYGLNMSVIYRNFDLSVFGQGINGTNVAFEVYQLHPFFHGQDNPRRFHMKRWTESNPDQYAIYPRIYDASDPHTSYNRAFSSYSLYNSDYFRIKTITLGYLVPKSALSKLNMNSMKFFLTGENLLTIRADKKMKDFDPETAGSVVSALGTKSMALGVNFSF